MKVMHVLCSLTAISAFCILQASHRVFLDQREIAWRKSTEPNVLARLKNWWNAPKSQKITEPVLAQENPWLKQLDVAGEERDKAFKALKNINSLRIYNPQYSEILNKKNEFFNKQRAYKNLGRKFYDLKHKELEQEMREDYRSSIRYLKPKK
jgi:hypothetical protein